MLSNLSGWHALVILTIVLLVFGSAKMPALARSVGESMRILKDEAATRPNTDRPDIAASDVAAQDLPRPTGSVETYRSGQAS